MQTEIIRVLKGTQLTKTQLARQTGFHRKTVVKALNSLIDMGFVAGEFGLKEPGHYKKNERFHLK